MDSPQVNRSKTIVKNTLLLYSRMFVVLFISLFTSRLVLNILGVTDFGIYSVVGGIVVIFNVLSASLSESTSRFLSFSIGQKDIVKLRGYFHNAKFVYIILGVITFVVTIAIGLWLIDNKLLIPVERLNAARVVLVFSIFSFILKIHNIPYNALIISNERMAFFATFGIIEVLFKLINVLLLYLINYDHLIVFAVLSITEPIFNKVILTYYCKKNFSEVCRGRLIEFDKTLFNEMIHFAGWDMLGAVERILQDQGVNIVINLFCLPSINAARAISMQIKSAVTQFTANFQVAVNPQIVKSYATKDVDYLHFLIYRTSKFSFFLLLLFVCPIMAHTEFILSLWLGDVPEHAVLFVRLIMILVLSDTFYEILNQGAKATGNLKKFRIYTSAVSLLNLPVSYIFLSLGFIPEITVVITIALNIFVLITQLAILKGLIGINMRKFMVSVVFPSYTIGIAGIVFFMLTSDLDITSSLVWFVLHSLVCTSLLLICIYYCGLTSSERSFVATEVVKRIRKFVNRA